VAPGTFQVTLEVDGTAGESRTFEVRNDPASSVTLEQHQEREAFIVDVMDLQKKVETLGAEVSKRRAAANGEEATRLQALELRLIGGAGARGARGGGGGGQPMRQRLNTLINAFVGSGARTGTMSAPTGTMRDALAEAKATLAAIEKEIK
jgi:hypothetical protein